MASPRLYSLQAAVWLALLLTRAVVAAGPDTTVVAYVWEFQYETFATDELTERLTNEFESEISDAFSGHDCCTLLQRRGYSRLKNHLEAEVKRLQGASSDSKRVADSLRAEIQTLGANTVIFGTVDDDVEGGVIAVTIRVEALDSRVLANKRRTLRRGLRNDPASRAALLDSLAQDVIGALAPAPEAPDVCTVELRSRPASADVAVGGVPRGVTPYSLVIPRGDSRAVTLEKDGYTGYSGRVDCDTPALDVRLKKRGGWLNWKTGGIAAALATGGILAAVFWPDPDPAPTCVLSGFTCIQDTDDTRTGNYTEIQVMTGPAPYYITGTTWVTRIDNAVEYQVDTYEFNATGGTVRLELVMSGEAAYGSQVSVEQGQHIRFLNYDFGTAIEEYELSPGAAQLIFRIDVVNNPELEALIGEGDTVRVDYALKVSGAAAAGGAGPSRQHAGAPLPIAAEPTREVRPAPTGERRLAIHPGWNVVRNPQEDAVSWDDVMALNGLGQRLWRWAGQWTGAEALPPRHAGQAHYFYNDTGASTLVLPPPASRFSPPAARPDAMTLTAVVDGVASAPVTLRLPSEPARTGAACDQVAPPFRTNETRLVLSNEGRRSGEGSQREHRLAEACLPTPGSGRRFVLQLEGGMQAPFRLDVGNAEAVGALEVRLIDPARGNVYDLRTWQSLHLEPVDERRPFVLLVGDEAFVRAEASRLSGPAHVLEETYPNPFSTLTTIPLRLAPSDERVGARLTVLNLLGQPVRTLLDADLFGGLHTVTWDGTDDSGRPVAAGLYLCRLQVGTWTALQTTTLLR